MYQQQGQPMPEKDMMTTMLDSLKLTAKEYATAVTESNCQSVRQLFTDLLHNTLNMQGHLYEVMKQQNMYKTPSPAPKQELDKQLQQHQQSEQETQQFLQQAMGGQAGMTGSTQQFGSQQLHQQQQPLPQHYM